MEPRDLDMAQMPLAVNSKSGPGISSDTQRRHGRLSDGHTAALMTKTPSDIMRRLLTIADGEPLASTNNTSNDREPLRSPEHKLVYPNPRPISEVLHSGLWRYSVYSSVLLNMFTPRRFFLVGLVNRLAELRAAI